MKSTSMVLKVATFAITWWCSRVEELRRIGGSG